ncbi:MAG: signal peptidase II [Clostridia bacterium]|nr:signal peptidase II [Clostridia bacterium]
MIYSLLVCLAVIILDQLSKYLVVQYIAEGATVRCIDGLFHLTYIKNRGAAFGMLADHRWVFMAVSVIAIVAIIVYMWRTKPKNMWLKTALGMIVGGGIGNMIDRTVNGYVVDFFEVEFVNFAVFNVADAFVCVACGILIVYVIVSSVKESREAKAAALSSGESAADGQNDGD